MKHDSDPSDAAELASLEPWDHNYWLSRAFIEASASLCTSMLEGDFSSQYSSSRVILHLERQGIEFFFKASLLAFGEPIDRYGHNLHLLFDAYHRRFPEPEFEVRLPARFQVAPTSDLFPDLMTDLHKTFDQRHRYATDKKGNTFATPEIFDPIETLQELQALGKELQVLEWSRFRPMLRGASAA